jgi:hypothetical protein
MSYRHRVYKLPKSFIEDCRACDTKEDFQNIYIKYCTDERVDIESLREENYWPLYHLGKQLFDFGDGYGNAEKMYLHGDSLFNSIELREAYDHNCPIVLDESGLLCAIEWNRNKVADIYEDLMREKSSDRWNTQNQFDRMKAHIHDKCQEWRNTDFPDLKPYDLSDSKSIVSSWLFEYQIFDLVRVYKSIDWENDCILFYGW